MHCGGRGDIPQLDSDAKMSAVEPVFPGQPTETGGSGMVIETRPELVVPPGDEEYNWLGVDLASTQRRGGK